MPNPVFEAFLLKATTLQSEVKAHPKPAGDATVFNKIVAVVDLAIAGLQQAMDENGWKLWPWDMATFASSFSSQVKHGLEISRGKNIIPTDPESVQLAQKLLIFLQDSPLPLTGAYRIAKPAESSIRNKRSKQLGEIIASYPPLATAQKDPNGSPKTRVEYEPGIATDVKHDGKSEPLQAAPTSSSADMLARLRETTSQMQQEAQTLQDRANSSRRTQPNPHRRAEQLRETEDTKAELAAYSTTLTTQIAQARRIENSLIQTCEQLTAEQQSSKTKSQILQQSRKQYTKTNKLPKYNAKLADAISLDHDTRTDWQIHTQSRLSKATDAFQRTIINRGLKTAWAAPTPSTTPENLRQRLLGQIDHTQTRLAAIPRELEQTNAAISDTQNFISEASHLNNQITSALQITDLELFKTAAEALQTQLNAYEKNRTSWLSTIQKWFTRSYVSQTKDDIVSKLKQEIDDLLKLNPKTEGGTKLLTQLRDKVQAKQKQNEETESKRWVSWRKLGLTGKGDLDDILTRANTNLATKRSSDSTNSTVPAPNVPPLAASLSSSHTRALKR